MRTPERVEVNVLNMNSGRARGGALEERGDSASSRPPPLAAGADVWRPVAVVRPGSGCARRCLLPYGSLFWIYFILAS